jgi:hypothetical protein
MRYANSNALGVRAGKMVAVALALGLVGLAPATPAFAQGDKTIRSGTMIRVRVETPVRSTTVDTGAPFRAQVVSPVVVTGEEAVPAGTLLLGRVIAVDSKRAWGQPSGVTLQVDQLESESGVRVPVVGDLTDLNGGAFTTVDNLTSGSEIMFRVGRTFTVGENFYMPAGGGGQGGDDVFDTAATVAQAQSVLRDLGYYSGPGDGRLSAATRAAIGLFQRDQRLRQTGFLDRETISRLGLIGESGQEVAAVNVISADAMLHGNDQLHVRIVAQTNTGGWQVFEDHFRQRDTMHIYVRGIRPTGIATQAVSNKELTLVLTATEFQGLNRIVVHGTGREIAITANDFNAETGSLSPAEAAVLEGQISRVLSDYARALGVRYVPVTGQLVMTRANYRENEVELLFAINSLAASARLYTQIVRATNDPQAIKGATDLFVAQSNIVDRAVSRTNSGRAAIVARNWPSLRDSFARMGNGPDRNLNDQGVSYRP